MASVYAIPMKFIDKKALQRNERRLAVCLKAQQDILKEQNSLFLAE
jgi:hypothetical protein